MLKSIITKIVGGILIFMGALILLAGLTEMFGDPGFFLFCLVFAALLVFPAVVLIRWGSRDKQANPYAYNPGGYPYQPYAGAPQPYTTDPQATTTVTPVVTPQQPQQPQRPAPVAPQQPAPTINALDSLLARSSDLYPSLKDLVNHDLQGNRDSADAHAAAVLLAAGGILGWDPTPRATMTKLNRTGKLWTNYPSDDLSDDDYHRIVATEAALNVAEAIVAAGVTASATSDQIVAAARERILSSLDAPLPSWDPAPELALAYPGTAPRDTPGEWLERMGVSFYAENYPADLRISYDMASDVSSGLSCISVEMPTPAEFAPYAADEQDRVALARTYAVRLCALMARIAFAACGKVTRVVVNAHEHGSSKALLSLDVDRAALERLTPAIASDAVTRGGFPQDPAVTARFDERGWFDEVSCAVTLFDDPVSAASRYQSVELDGRACTPALHRATGARVNSDLGINENAGRVRAFEELLGSLDGTTGDVVSRLVALRDAAEGDLTVVEACERTSAALVDGTLDVTDVDRIRSTFVNGSALDRAVLRADELADVPEGEEPHFEEALAILEEALAPIEQVGLYLDDSSTVYRYFGSVAERIRFNRDIDDHERAVRLVPDSYFRAHILCARFLNFLERYDEALAHGAIVQRIAPASTDAALVVVRVLENQSKTYEAADLLKETLKLASTARDAALCHYRLAYMQWKLGRTDLAIACYQRALRWNTDTYDQARVELDDLLAGNPEYKRLTDEEALEALNAADIPIGGSRAVSDANLAAAIACIDDGLFSVARPLMAIEFELVRDDTLVNVYRSLIP